MRNSKIGSFIKSGNRCGDVAALVAFNRHERAVWACKNAVRYPDGYWASVYRSRAWLQMALLKLINNRQEFFIKHNNGYWVLGLRNGIPYKEWYDFSVAMPWKSLDG